MGCLAKFRTLHEMCRGKCKSTRHLIMSNRLLIHEVLESPRRSSIIKERGGGRLREKFNAGPILVIKY